MLVLLHPDQALEAERLSRELDLPVEQVVAMLLSGPLANLREISGVR